MNRNVTRWIGIVCAALAMIMLWAPWIKPNNQTAKIMDLAGNTIKSELFDEIDGVMSYGKYFLDDDVNKAIKQVKKAISCIFDQRISPAELITISRGFNSISDIADIGELPEGIRVFSIVYPLLFLFSLGLGVFTLAYRILGRRNRLDWVCFITRILIFLILFVLVISSKNLMSDFSDEFSIPITVGIRITLWSVLAVLLSAPMGLLSRIPIPAGIDQFEGIHSANAVVNNIAGTLSEQAGKIRGFAGSGWRCEKCGKSNQKEYGFCQRCGAKKPLPPRCPACGNELKGNSPYCGFCGKQIRQPERQSRCPRCGRTVPHGVSFCGHCGTPMTQNGGGMQPRLCPRCRKPLHPGAPFCGNCGYRGR